MLWCGENGNAQERFATGKGQATNSIKRYKPGNWQELLAVVAAIELGIFETLFKQPASARELAEKLGYDLRATETLLLALANLKHLLETDGRYSVADDIAAVVADKKSPAYAPNAILHQRNLLERWITIPEVVRSGKQVPRPYTKKRREVFIHSMDDASRGSAATIVDLCLKRQPDIHTVLDVGGGPGTYARVFAERGIDVTILDQPQVIEIVEPELSPWPRIKMVPGDFNEGLPAGRFDLVLMANIFHIYGPEKDQELLSRARQALNEGGVAAIVDLVRGRSSRAPLFALTMLVNTDGGGTWTEEQYRDWMRQAGFEDAEFIDVEERDSQLILASSPR